MAFNAAAGIKFLSTPSARRATNGTMEGQRKQAISIHALREEGDAVPEHIARLIDLFLSTPSARRATSSQTSSQASTLRFLSTPSARRATWAKSCGCRASKHFYPRPPRGGRLAALPKYSGEQEISIHALREEGDREAINQLTFILKFLSTPSVRRATSNLSQLVRVCLISIHALREEGDR